MAVQLGREKEYEEQKTEEPVGESRLGKLSA